LLERRPAVLAARRALATSGVRLLVARSPAALEAMLARELIDAILLGIEAARGPVLDALRRDYTATPLLLFGPVRAEDAGALLHAARSRAAGLALEGIDEPVLGRMLERCGATARRRDALLPLANPLGLTDPLQQRAWELVVTDAPLGLDTAALAKRLDVARETLSRRFAAGGAPSLKQAIDVARLVAASQLLGNPAFGVTDVARLAGFSSPSLLHRTARRALGVPLREVASLDGPRLVERLRGAAIGWR
jgi:AraC-like DNA-binding protein